MYVILMGVSRYYLRNHGYLPRWTEYQPDEYSSFIMRLLNPKQNELILDDGAGNGRFSVAIAEEGAEIISLDINKKLLKTAAENFRQKRLHDKAQFILADIQNLPFNSYVFDKVLCVHNLWYVADYRKATSEMFRALKNGGEVVLDQLNLLTWRACIGEFIYIIMRILRRNHSPIFYRTPRQILGPFKTYRTESFIISFGSGNALSFKRGKSLRAPRFIIKSSRSHA